MDTNYGRHISQAASLILLIVTVAWWCNWPRSEQNTAPNYSLFYGGIWKM